MKSCEGCAFLFMKPEIEELYQEVILDHSRRPRKFGKIARWRSSSPWRNPACGDEIHLAVKFEAGGGLEDIKFTGSGCAISRRRLADDEEIEGEKTREALEMFRAFHDLVTDDENEAPKTPGDFRVMGASESFRNG